MNSDYETRLETEIDAELKALPLLAAPRMLHHRVLAAILQKAKLPWYRQSWQMWPLAWRAGSLAFLIALFGGLCFVGWDVSHGATFAAATQRLGAALGGVTTLWKALNALLSAGVLVIKSLGTGFIIGCLAALGLGYALCIGLGTFYVRLALARR